LANVKISALPAATTPLAGTEVLPIVQSGTTVKVSVADLTSGRAITASNVTDSALTSGRVTYATTGGLLTDSASLTFNGTILSTPTLNLANALGIAYGGTGQVTANASFNALAPSQTGNSGKYLTTDGTNTSWATNPLGTVTSVSTGTGLTGGPITTSGTISFSNANVGTWAATPSSANLAAAMTDETGTGSLVFNTNPTFIGPFLGTPSSGSLLYCTDYPTSALNGTINLATQVSGTLAVNKGGTGITTLTTGYIPFGAGTSAFNSSSNLFWDNTNTRLGIGTSSPQYALDISSGSTVSSRLQASGSSTDAKSIYTSLGPTGTTVTLWAGTFGSQSAGVITTLTNHPLIFGTFNQTNTMTFGTSGILTVPTLNLTNPLGAAYGGTGATTLTGYVYGNGTGAMTASTTIPTSSLSGTINLTTQVTGTLPVANGGTGVTTSTGSGNNVLSASPTLTGTVAGASLSLSSLTSGRVTYATTGGLLTDSSSLTFDGNNLGIGGTQSYSGYRTLLVQGTNVSNGGVIQIQNSDSSVQSYWLNTSALVNFGSISSTPVGFITGNTERMRITSAGNVGIGTSSPGYQLDVSATGSVTALRIANTANAGVYANWSRPNQSYLMAMDINNNGGTDFSLYNATSSALMYQISSSGNLGLGVTPSAWSQGKAFEFVNSGYGLWNGGSSTYITANMYYNGGFKYANTGSQASNYYQYQGQHIWNIAPSGTAGNAITFTQAMTLDNSGNLGIGVTSPTSRLHIQSDTPVKINNAAGSAETTLIFVDSGATLRLNQFYSTGSNIAFYTNANGGGVTERMRIDSSGNLLVGTTTGGTGITSGITLQPNSGASFQQIGHVTGTASGAQYIGFSYNGGLIANITQSGTTAVLYNTSSDQRLKTNIVDAPSGNIDDIKVRSFDWKSDNSHQTYGMVAQELLGVAPYAVYQPQDTEEMMGVDYSKLVPMMIKEIQDLKQRIATLENK
jgi:hypothetical protein